MFDLTHYYCLIDLGSGSDYRRSMKQLNKFKDELSDKKRMAEQLSNARKARLEQYKQLYLCEKDAKQVSRTAAPHRQVVTDVLLHRLQSGWLTCMSRS